MVEDEQSFTQYWTDLERQRVEQKQSPTLVTQLGGPRGGDINEIPKAEEETDIGPEILAEAPTEGVDNQLGMYKASR
jgi:hypothetical protein